MAAIVIVLNRGANWLGAHLLSPLAVLPGWLSATLVAVVTGFGMLLVFKYTSQQQAIQGVRNAIKADLLALSLFKESIAVSLRCQGNLLLGAGRLMLLSVVPVLVMTLPMCLLLAQLALWYQARPLAVGEAAVLTVSFNDTMPEMPAARLEPTAAAAIDVGPVRVPGKHMVCWSVVAAQPGYNSLRLDIGGRTIEKELAVGDGFMQVSLCRPPADCWETLVHPREAPFPPDSPVRSITIDYPERKGWTSGTGSWLIYWFGVSMVAAFCARPLLKVNI